MTRDQQKRTIPVNAQVHLDAMIQKLYRIKIEMQGNRLVYTMPKTV